MNLAHGAAASAGVTGWLPLVPLLVAGLAYAAGVARLQARGDTWPVVRTAALTLGLLCLGAALLPPLALRDDHFPVHAGQHLLLSALGPLLLVRAAPVTLALRTLPAAGRRGLLQLLHSRPAAVLLSAPLVLVLQVAAPFALYLTPLYGLAETHAWLHAAVHAHVLLTGCLFALLVAGVDPLPSRPGVRARLVLLVLAAGAHDVLSKTLYARGLPAAGPLADVQAGAQLMYYGAGAVELLLAVLLLADWWARGTRELARDRRRSAAPAG